MRIVIVGAGVVGLRVARALVEEGRDVVLIERNAEAARVAMNELDSLVLHDDGTSPEALAEAGVAEAEIFIALTGSDEANIVACSIVAAQAWKPRRIARCRNPFYLGLRKESRAVMGVDELINPEAETADLIVREIEEGVDRDLVLLPGELRMRPLHIGPDSPFAGKSLIELRKASERPFLIPALVRAGAFMIPTGTDRLSPGDTAYVLAEEGDLAALLGISPRPALKRIVLVGATRTAELLVSKLEEERNSGSFLDRLRSRLGGSGAPSLTLLEKNVDKAKRLARAFPKLLVLNLGVSEDSLDVDEALGGADLVVSLTDSQSLNLVTGLRAKRLGAARTLALVQTDAYRKLAPHMDVDAVMSLEDSVVNSALAMARRANIKTLHSFAEEDAELIELTVAAESEAAGKRIRELSLPKGALILYVLRPGKPEIPGGDTFLSHGDKLCLIATRNLLKRLELFFGGSDGS